MAKIKTLLNDRGQAKTGNVAVNSKNVDPSTRTALAAGLNLIAADFVKWDFLNCVQTSAATDAVVIPAGLAVGSEMWFHAESAMEVNVSTGETHNNAAATTAVSCAIGTTTRYLKVNATDWIVTQFSIAGAVTAPTPS